MPDFNPFDFLLESTPIWIQNLDAIVHTTEQRVGSVSPNSSAPGLSTRNDTTVALSTLNSEPRSTRAPPQTPTHHCNPRKRTRSVSPTASRHSTRPRLCDYRQRSAMSIYYDGASQKLLEGIVAAISRAQHALQKRKIIRDRSVEDNAADASVLKCLAKLSDLSYAAAFKLLQDGDLNFEVSTAKTIIAEIQAVVKSSNARQPEPAKAQQTSNNNLSYISTSPLPFKIPTQDALLFEYDDEEEEEDEDIELPPIRLTSRLNAR